MIAKWNAEQKLHAMSSEDASLIAIGDADWVFDAFALQTVEHEGIRRQRPLNDNLTLLLNLVEFASGKEELIAIRSKGAVARPFERVVDLHRRAQARYREQEQRLLETLTTVEQKIAAAVDTAGVQGANELPQAFKDEVSAINKRLSPTRRALRDIRRKIREDVEALGRRITLLNLVSGPALALLLAGIAFGFRRRVRWFS